jgi:hypothetical protein
MEVAMKKVVRFSHVVLPLRVGHRALVQPLDHPGPDVSNTTLAVTSPIVRVASNDEFETDNTVYVRSRVN